VQNEDRFWRIRMKEEEEEEESTRDARNAIPS